MKKHHFQFSQITRALDERSTNLFAFNARFEFLFNIFNISYKLFEEKNEFKRKWLDFLSLYSDINPDRLYDEIITFSMIQTLESYNEYDNLMMTLQYLTTSHQENLAYYKLAYK